jgi:hypothetical protein
VVNDTEKGYYADGEDAYYMRCYSKNSKQETMDESAVESRTEQLHNLEVSANQCIEVCKTHDTLFCHDELFLQKSVADRCEIFAVFQALVDPKPIDSSSSSSHIFSSSMLANFLEGWYPSRFPCISQQVDDITILNELIYFRMTI